MNQFSELQPWPFHQGEKIIHFSQDEYGRILVIDDGKQRILNFDSPFEQSCMQLSYPYQLVHHYTRFMVLAVAFVDPVHITLFGLGGGSLLRTLHQVLPNCTFQVVELRQAVVGIAKEYFLLPKDHRVRITINDASEEVSQMDSNSSDIIFADMYGAYRMAPEQIKKTFLLECTRVLTDQGFLVINLHNLPNDRSAFFEMLKNIFSTVMLSASTDNIVLFASNAPPERVEPNVQRMEGIEENLHQRLTPLLARLQRINVQIAP